MKKTYCKPQIAFESFELTSSIAAGCAIPANQNLDGQCSITIGGMDLIAWNGCEFDYNDQKSTMGVKVCYDIPTWDTVLFTS